MRFRVINWGTGNVGYHALRATLRNPALELVGLHAHSEAKQGKDAADIAGLAITTGILATNDVDALLALKPDVVIYTANGEMRPAQAYRREKGSFRTCGGFLSKSRLAPYFIENWRN